MCIEKNWELRIQQVKGADLEGQSAVYNESRMSTTQDTEATKYKIGQE